MYKAVKEIVSPSERRYLTIMFIDLVGYTTLSERLDPEELSSLVVRYQQLALSVMERFGGFVASFAGDGILVYFGYPTAHGNDAERALRAALEMISLLDGLNVGALGDPSPLSARIGVHTGLVVVGPERLSSGPYLHAVVGEAANVAARLQSEAPTMGIIVSKDTQHLVERLFDFSPLGSLALKGLSRPVEAFQLIRAKPLAETQSVPRPQSSAQMVGRDADLSRLLQCWEQARANSRCRVVVIVGEPGVGKTRLIHEFFSHPSLGDVAIAQTQCHEISRSSALSPISGFFWKRAGLVLDDAQDSRRQKLGRFLEQLGLWSEDNEELLGRIPGLSSPLPAETVENANLFKLRQFKLIGEIFQKTAASRPMILSIEDAHWLDPSSAELLREIPRFLEQSPFLLAFTTRSFPKGQSLPKPDELIRLEQLSPDDSFEIASAVPGAQNLPKELVWRAVRSADGVPLFVEQLVLSLVEQGTKDLEGGSKTGHLPLLLAEMLSERLDRRPGARQIVHAAACIGHSFSPESLAAILGENVTSLRGQLDLLVDAEILRPTRYGLELRYEFRHALLQFMAVEAMVAPERRGMHAKIAEFLETTTNLPSPPEESAYHLT
jgi:class 3 adenylate cyclase